MSKPIADVESINSLCYELAHDIDLDKKSWIIPALKSHVHQLARENFAGYNEGRVARLIHQWIEVHQGRMNPIPRSLP